MDSGFKVWLPTLNVIEPVFLRAKKLWVNPPKAERAKPSLSSDYNLLFKNKIGESSLDIHRNPYIHICLYPLVKLQLQCHFIVASVILQLY